LAEQKNIKIERPHFKNLDGLRFLAAFSVFIFHFVRELKEFVPDFSKTKLFEILSVFTENGILGVNFFFVLSGFLITYLILFEIKNKGSFNYKNFLIRRALRIWPLYYLIVLLGFFIFPLLFNDYHTNHHLINYIFFLANFDEIYYGANDGVNFLTSPWSVAVEEQFYLFWGILFFALSFFYYKNKLESLKLPFIILLLLFISFLFRNNVSQYHTISVLPDILIGASLAYLYITKSKWLTYFYKMSSLKIGIIYLLGIIFILFKSDIFNGHLLVLQRYLTALFFAFVILDQISFKNSIFKIEKIKGTAYLGKISYGIYMYHLVVMFLLHKFIDFNQFSDVVSIFLVLILSLGLTFLISLASYKWFEKPFLKLKRKFN